jgi:outer membrane protein assembly factor BamB
MGFLMLARILLIAVVVTGGGCAGIKIVQPLRTTPHDWITYGGNPQRHNASGADLKPPLATLWEYNALAGIRSTPVVRDSIVVIATLHGELQAIHLRTGKRLGYVVFESAIAGTPVLDATNAIVACAGGNETLVSYSLKEGKKNWGMQYGPIESDLLLLGEEVYCTTLDGFAYSIRKSDGMQVWKFDSSIGGKRKPIRSSPASDGNVIIFGSDDGVVWALDRRSGLPRWKVETGASIFAAPVVMNGRVLIANVEGKVVCLSVDDGTILWKKETGVPVYAPAAASGTVFYLGASDGTLRAYDAATGEVRWTFQTRSVLSSAPLLAGNILYVGSLDRTFYAIRIETGEELWRSNAPGRIRVSPVIWKDVLLLTSEDKYVLALTAATQSSMP